MQKSNNYGTKGFWGELGVLFKEVDEMGEFFEAKGITNFRYIPIRML
jgi:hypothetical protein